MQFVLKYFGKVFCFDKKIKMQGFRISNSLIELSYFPKLAQLLIKYSVVKYSYWSKSFCYFYSNYKLKVDVEL